MPLDLRILDEIDNSHTDRLMTIKAAWEAYEGKMPVPLKQIPSDPEGKDNIILSQADVIVDTSVDFLFGKGLEWETDKEKGEGRKQTPEEEYLDGFWRQNKKQIFLTKTGQNGAVTGHALIKMVKPSRGYEYPRLINWDTANVRFFSDVEDYEDIFAFVYEWMGVKWVNGKRKPVLRRQVIERADGRQFWTIQDWELERFNYKLGIIVIPGGRSQWVPLGGPETWPYPWAPVFHCQNLPMANCIWGKPDLTEDILGINHGINFSASNNQRIERMHAHPFVWSRLAQGLSMDRSIDAIPNIPSEKGEINVLAVGYEGMEQARENYKVKKDALHEKSRTPLIALGKVDDIGNLSGLALSILYGPLLAKTQTKQFLYGEMLAEINKRALELAGHAVEEVRNLWGNLVPSDRKEQVDALTAETGLGLSKQTALKDLGRDAEEELKASEAEQQAAMDREINKEKALIDAESSMLDRGAVR